MTCVINDRLINDPVKNGQEENIGCLPFSRKNRLHWSKVETLNGNFHGMFVFHFHGHLHQVEYKPKGLELVEKANETHIFRSMGYSGWEFWTISEDVPFISEIFRSGKPKQPFHLHSNRNFRNVLVMVNTH